jgi:hypothetical protein
MQQKALAWLIRMTSLLIIVPTSAIASSGQPCGRPQKYVDTATAKEANQVKSWQRWL